MTWTPVVSKWRTSWSNGLTERQDAGVIIAAGDWLIDLVVVVGTTDRYWSADGCVTDKTWTETTCVAYSANPKDIIIYWFSERSSRTFKIGTRKDLVMRPTQRLSWSLWCLVSSREKLLFSQCSVSVCLRVLWLNSARCRLGVCGHQHLLHHCSWGTSLEMWCSHRLRRCRPPVTRSLTTAVISYAVWRQNHSQRFRQCTMSRDDTVYFYRRTE